MAVARRCRATLLLRKLSAVTQWPPAGYESLYFDRDARELRGGIRKYLGRRTPDKIPSSYMDELDYQEPLAFEFLIYVAAETVWRSDMERFRRRFREAPCDRAQVRRVRAARGRRAAGDPPRVRARAAARHAHPVERRGERRRGAPVPRARERARGSPSRPARAVVRRLPRPGGSWWRAPRNPSAMPPNARRGGGACARRPRPCWPATPAGWPS